MLSMLRKLLPPRAVAAGDLITIKDGVEGGIVYLWKEINSEESILEMLPGQIGIVLEVASLDDGGSLRRAIKLAVDGYIGWVSVDYVNAPLQSS